MPQARKGRSVPTAATWPSCPPRVGSSPSDFQRGSLATRSRTAPELSGATSHPLSTPLRIHTRWRQRCAPRARPRRSPAGLRVSRALRRASWRLRRA
eukprot:1913912-Prymnesium_polylepis.1